MPSTGGSVRFSGPASGGPTNFSTRPANFSNAAPRAMPSANIPTSTGRMNSLSSPRLNPSNPSGSPSHNWNGTTPNFAHTPGGPSPGGPNHSGHEHAGNPNGPHGNHCNYFPRYGVGLGFGGWWYDDFLGDYGYPYWETYYADYAPVGQYLPSVFRAVESSESSESPIEVLPPGTSELPAPSVSTAPPRPTLDLNGDAAKYLADARQAFKSGDFAKALRSANHAAVESPHDARIHEFMSLALFAQNDYRGAALEAHAALALGPVSNWETLSSFYPDDAVYTAQLRKFEDFVRANESAPEGHFLAAYHYLMTGFNDAARQQLSKAIQLAPKDEVAQQLWQTLNR